ncbi:MAG: hypothetical protein K9K21_08585 [Desulfotignum sp.]|nr:hypothetical protein [Desulfotignum sp.]MCF8113889.1 hypothetical protein [Desulfotignum sp.]
MELETLINIGLVFLFLFITIISKSLKRSKKKKARVQEKQTAKPMMFSFFHKIKDQIQQSLQELEKQARQEQAKQKKEKQGSDVTFWDELADEGLILEEETPPDAEPARASVDTKEKDRSQKKPDDIRTSEKKALKEEVPPPTIHPYGRRPSLRQAVIWSEIIGKPAALRKDHSDFII